MKTRFYILYIDVKIRCQLVVVSLAIFSSPNNAYHILATDENDDDSGGGQVGQNVCECECCSFSQFIAILQGILKMNASLFKQKHFLNKSITKYLYLIYIKIKIYTFFILSFINLYSYSLYSHV